MVVVLGFKANLTVKVILRQLVMHMCFLAFSHTSTNLRGERRKYALKKVCLNRVPNSQPPGHESNTLTIEPLGRGKYWVNMVHLAKTY